MKKNIIQYKINEIKDFLKSKGLIEDRWGNFKTTDKIYRYKFNPTSLRVEFKGNMWIKEWSAYYKDIEITECGLKPLKFIEWWRMNQDFTINKRNYNNAVNNIIHRVKTKTLYPDNNYDVGIKSLFGEKYLFNMIAEEEIRKAKIPKVLKSILLGGK